MYSYKPRVSSQSTSSSSSSSTPSSSSSVSHASTQYGPTPPRVQVPPPRNTAVPPPGYSYMTPAPPPRYTSDATSNLGATARSYSDASLGASGNVQSLLQGIRKATGYHRHRPKKKAKASSTAKNHKNSSGTSGAEYEEEEYISTSGDDEEEEEEEEEIEDLDEDDDEEEEEGSSVEEPEDTSPPASKKGKRMRPAGARMDRAGRMILDDVNNNFRAANPSVLLDDHRDPFVDLLDADESNTLVQWKKRQMDYLSKVEQDPHFRFWTLVAHHARCSKNLSRLIRVPGPEESSLAPLMDRNSRFSGLSQVVQGLVPGMSMPVNPNPDPNFANNPVEGAASIGNTRTLYDLLRSPVDQEHAKDFVRRQKLLNNAYLMSRPEVVGVLKLEPDALGGLEAARSMLQGFCRWLPRKLNFDYFILNDTVSADFAELVGLKVRQPDTMVGGTQRLATDERSLWMRMEMLCAKFNTEYAWDEQSMSFVYAQQRNGEHGYAYSGIGSSGYVSSAPRRMIFPVT